MGKNLLLFEARFADGHVIAQNQDDLSRNTEGKNCFYDVQEYDRTGSPLVAFILQNEERTWQMGVDMTDGHFELNGQVFWLHRPDLVEERYSNFQPVYYRVTQQHIKTVVATGEVLEVKEELAGYVLGWKVLHTPKGKRKARSIEKFVRI